ncbi:MAG: Rrf2 family transcriptional regulator [Candidatus Margulisiibacteriota bacterium]
MKITFKGDYALKAILDLSANFGAPQRIEEVARRQDIPVKFLEQILLSLKKGGFVRSLRGRSGGYELARAPEKITLGQIIRYIEGPVEPISCVLKKGGASCNFADRCVLRDVFDEIGSYVAKKVDSLTFAELRDRQKKREIQRKKFLDYSI